MPKTKITPEDLQTALDAQQRAHDKELAKVQQALSSERAIANAARAMYALWALPEPEGRVLSANVWSHERVFNAGRRMFEVISDQRQ